MDFKAFLYVFVVTVPISIVLSFAVKGFTKVVVLYGETKKNIAGILYLICLATFLFGAVGLYYGGIATYLYGFYTVMCAMFFVVMPIIFYKFRDKTINKLFLTVALLMYYFGLNVFVYFNFIS